MDLESNRPQVLRHLVDFIFDQLTAILHFLMSLGKKGQESLQRGVRAFQELHRALGVIPGGGLDDEVELAFEEDDEFIDLLGVDGIWFHRFRLCRDTSGYLQ
jgi:hypothetical protein